MFFFSLFCNCFSFLSVMMVITVRHILIKYGRVAKLCQCLPGLIPSYYLLFGSVIDFLAVAGHFPPWGILAIKRERREADWAKRGGRRWRKGKKKVSRWRLARLLALPGCNKGESTTFFQFVLEHKLGFKSRLWARKRVSSSFFHLHTWPSQRDQIRVESVQNHGSTQLF